MATRRTFMNKHVKPDTEGMTLLQKAQALTVVRKSNGKPFTDEQLELVEAWLKDELIIGKVQAVMGYKNSVQTYVFLARGVKHLYRKATNG